MSAVHDHADALAAKHIEARKGFLDKLKDLTNQQLREKGIDCLVLDSRVHNCLLKAGLKKVGSLEGITWPELLNIRGLGVYSSSQLIETMRYVGFIIIDNDPDLCFSLSPDREARKDPKPTAEQNPKLSEADKQWEKIEQHLDAVKQPAKAEPYWEKMEYFSGATIRDFYMHPETHELMLFFSVNYKQYKNFMLLIHQVNPHLFRVEDYHQRIRFNSDNWMRRGPLFCFVWEANAYFPFTPTYTLSDEDNRKLELVPGEAEQGKFAPFLEIAEGAIRMVKERLLLNPDSANYFTRYAHARAQWNLWPKK